MNLSRRDLLASSAAIGALAVAGKTKPADAWTHGTATLPPVVGGKAQVNLNLGGNAADFPFLNFMKFADRFATTGGIPTADSFALTNADGYPTAICPGTTTWRSNTVVYWPGGESWFTGSVTGNVLNVPGTVTGDALFIGQTITDATNGGSLIPVQTRITGQVDSTHWTLSKTLGSPTGSISLQGYIPYVLDWQGNIGSIGASPGNSGDIIFPPPTYTINSNRIELNFARKSQGAGCTFTLNVTAGSNHATLTSIVGVTPFGGMNISGAGIPPYSTLAFDGANYFLNTVGSNGVLSYDLVNVATTGYPLAKGDLVEFSFQFSTITTTPSDVRLYLQTQEALLNSGQICAPHFINFYKQYGRLRFLNWANTNGSMLSNWEDRCPTTAFTWIGSDTLVPNKYAGQCPATGTNHFVGPNALPGNPSSWIDKTMVQFSVSNCPAGTNFIATIDNGSGSAGNTLTVSSVISGTIRAGMRIYACGDANGPPQQCNILSGSGTVWTVDGPTQLIASQQMMANALITSFSNANPAVVGCPNHGFSTGARVSFPGNNLPISGGTIQSSLNGLGGTSQTNWSQSYVITVDPTDPTNKFSLNGVDSTSWGTYVSGGILMYAPTFACGSLPPKPITSISINAFGVEFSGYQLFQLGFNNSEQIMLTGVYDVDLDVLIVGLSGQSFFGMPPEAAIQVVKEINGPDLWLSVPAFATDDFALQLSTTMKATLTDVTSLKWDFELSNEVWNTGQGFWQTEYAQAVANTKWPTTRSGSNISQWFGWRWYNMMQQVNAVFTGGKGDGKVVRILSFSSGDVTPDDRNLAPATGIPVPCLSLADELCHSDYISLNSMGALPPAESIYNYQQGILTNNNTLIQSALNDMDAMFQAFGCGPLFLPITGSIDDGAGGAGHILTVTNIATGGGVFIQPTNPRIGPYSIVGPFGGGNPATGTYVISQLTNTQPGGAPNKLGTYLCAGPAQLIPSTTFTIYGSAIDNLIWTTLPSWQGYAVTYGVGHCAYEGGYGDAPGAESTDTDYMGHPINQQDRLNLETAYQASAQYATSYGNYLTAAKAIGFTYSSAYTMTGIGPPNNGNMFGMVFQNIFGTATPAKAVFDAYNAS